MVSEIEINSETKVETTIEIRILSPLRFRRLEFRNNEKILTRNWINERIRAKLKSCIFQYS